MCGILPGAKSPRLHAFAPVGAKKRNPNFFVLHPKLDPIKTRELIIKLEKKDIQAASVLMEWVNQFDFNCLQKLIDEMLTEN